MTLDDLLDLYDHWKEHPPVQWMMQGYLGVGSNGGRTELSQDDLMQFARTGQLPG